MSDTFLSKSYGKVYCGDAHNEKRRKAVKIGEAGIYPGFAIRVAAGVAYLANSTDNIWSGIAADMPGEDLDTAYTYSATASACDKIEYYGRHVGQEVFLWYLAQSPAVNLLDGDCLVLSATDGLFMKFAYTDGTEATDAPTTEATCIEDITGSVTANKLVRAVI
jgi:hypothetical protein